jgi:5-methylcytosine-specific restriction endonuclease McrA
MDWGFRPYSKQQQTSRGKGKPNKKQRAEFSDKTRTEIKDRYDGQCGHCGNPGHHCHHVKPRGSGGRGVVTNGILLCAICHTKIHADPTMAKYYIEKFTSEFGRDFYKDELDKRG